MRGYLTCSAMVGERTCTAAWAWGMQQHASTNLQPLQMLFRDAVPQAWSCVLRLAHVPPANMLTLTFSILHCCNLPHTVELPICNACSQHCCTLRGNMHNTGCPCSLIVRVHDGTNGRLMRPIKPQLMHAVRTCKCIFIQGEVSQ